MYDNNYQLYLPVQSLRNKRGLSERKLSLRAGISRSCLRSIKARNQNLTLSSILALADFLERTVEVVLSSNSTLSEFSTTSSALKVERDGFNSWKIHFMDFVDHFRSTLDCRLILLPPHSNFDKRLTALLASLVNYLCQELEIPVPTWAAKRYFLESPWFVSETEALKATAILEAPTLFRNNNIFVQANFLDRV